jgi:hypothetical protein
MNIKSERLKKLEIELHDLEQWLKLGLVPKKDMEKHKTEIKALQEKIGEEKERLKFLKESGAMEEYASPKRPAHARPVPAEPHTLPDVEIAEEGLTDVGLEMQAESYQAETSAGEEPEERPEGAEEEAPVAEEPEEEEEDPFSDRNRWKRGVLEDPDSGNW